MFCKFAILKYYNKNVNNWIVKNLPKENQVIICLNFALQMQKSSEKIMFAKYLM